MATPHRFDPPRSFATLLSVAALSISCATPALAQGPDATPPAAAALPASSASSATSSDALPGERRNWFDDPFIQATHGLAGCPMPDAPLLTEAEMIHESHWRAERGTSCYRSGRCRLPNAYLYDKEIAPRVVQAIHAAGTFDDTTVWVEGQRRWIWLKGCVSTPAQAQEMERIVRLIDDVEAVIPQLLVGTTMPPGRPVYRMPP
jgi:hypothetical protein